MVQNFAYMYLIWNRLSMGIISMCTLTWWLRDCPSGMSGDVSRFSRGTRFSVQQFICRDIYVGNTCMQVCVCAGV